MEAQRGPTMSSGGVDKKLGPANLPVGDFFERFIVYSAALGAAAVLHLVTLAAISITYRAQYERQSAWIGVAAWISAIVLVVVGLSLPWEKRGDNAILVAWQLPKTHNPQAIRLYALGSLLATLGGILFIISWLGIESRSIGLTLAGSGGILLAGGKFLATRKR